MIMTIAKVEGLKEIGSYAWIITCYTRAYIYSGAKSGLKDAVSRVENEPQNAGSQVRVKLVVS